jgi:hypothetical protein
MEGIPWGIDPAVSHLQQIENQDSPSQDMTVSASAV